ncbi:MAG TPA: 50S ribosomal protein L13 [Bacteroidetes bacterium]|nr:50S ribosomal protein L13 [Bacteroidota bacterium]HDL78391.1 50S ribosomal protein L13 [Bacteroidota bacterium]
MAKKGQVEQKWYVIDADGLILGRLASRVASIVRGKNKPIFTPHVDTGDNIVILNAEKVRLTGRKLDGKKYYHHSGYPGGIKEIPARKLLQEKPEEVLRHAIWGMLPHTKLGRKLLKKVKIYAGNAHPHTAQKPEILEF